MLSRELVLEIKIILFITVGLIIAPVVMHFTKYSQMAFSQYGIIILLLSIADLTDHLYRYRKLYQEIRYDGYESEVRNRQKYQSLNSNLKRVEGLIMICAVTVFFIGSGRAVIYGYDIGDYLIKASFALLWFILNLRQFLWKW